MSGQQWRHLPVWQVEDEAKPAIESLISYYPASSKRALITEAETYLQLFQKENALNHSYAKRFAEIQAEIEQRETYWQHTEELVYGAKVAWRNNTRCIGRLHWKTLQVRDMRHLYRAKEIFEALVEHLILATNGGKIKSMMTVFAPQIPGQDGIRIWNPQLIRYAGYRQSDGSILGDPLHIELTKAIETLGWKGGAGTSFDILPVVIQMPGQRPEFFELPPEAILEVPIQHPDFPWFGDLGLRWHALPTIANMRLEIGGISYTAAPFNGWYMGTEVGARNFGDVERYNMLPIIAKRMGLDIRTNRTLWKDRALVELNIAVLHSFAAQGITMVDHHTASQQFMVHTNAEKQAGRDIHADWGWIVPPMSASTTPVFHCPYEDVALKPNFFYQSASYL